MPETVGSRIKRYRLDASLSPTELAARANVSKSYLSELESDEEDRKPSADVLYRIADVLGVAMADLLGRPVLVTAASDRPQSLLDFAAQDRLPDADVAMLASIQFRGRRPETAERWRFIYQAIKGSEGIDRGS